MKIIQLGKKFKTKIFRETCYGIVKNGDKFLAVFSGKDNDYSLVGGGLEKNETKIDGLKREFLEETGYKILKTKELFCIDCYWIKKDKTKIETRANFFLIDIDLNNKLKPIENWHEICWLTKNQLFDLIKYPYQIEALKIINFDIGEE